jgi:hypothetical protein
VENKDCTESTPTTGRLSEFVILYVKRMNHYFDDGVISNDIEQESKYFRITEKLQN